MASDLDMLIDHYQWEILRIKEVIKENLEQHFYREVELDEKALGYAQRELDALLELRNPNYPHIKKAEHQIAFYQRLSEKKSLRFETKSILDFYEPQIRDAKLRLKQLRNTKVTSSFNETQILDEVLYGFLEDRLGQVKILLSKEQGTVIEVVKLDEKQLKLVFSNEDKDYWWYLEYSILSKMNFRLGPDGKELFLLFRLNSKNDVLRIKELIARVIIGLRAGRGIDKEIFLKVED